MWGKIERSREAVVQFLQTSNPDDEFFLVGFNDRPELLVDFTSSVDEMQDAFSNVMPDGKTALFDAIYLGLNRMKWVEGKVVQRLLCNYARRNTRTCYD
jgi:Ca-activated chloride channel family protein